MKLLQINSVVNSGSTGRIAEEIGVMVMKHNWESFIAYGRYGNKSKSETIKIGSSFNVLIHGLYSRLFDKHGYASVIATKKLILQIKEMKPDIIHLHNIHGYYINFEILFDFLNELSVPVVWTLHDCWSYTGHCVHYFYEKCMRWQDHCHDCPQLSTYPKSFVDNSFNNYSKKRRVFNSLDNLSLVPVSKWLGSELHSSFLSPKQVKQIYNGVDLEVFRIEEAASKRKKLGLSNKFVILGVANIWEERKGLLEFFKLSKSLGGDEVIILVGLSEKQTKSLPENIIGIQKTESVEDLVKFYNIADVFLNPTFEDTFPTTNIEALACGTPVITYDTGGSPEAIDLDTGWVVNVGDLKSVLKIINKLRNSDNFELYKENCRARALSLFNKNDRYLEYLNLYKSLLNN